MWPVDYMRCNVVDVQVFLHPRSALAAAAPEMAVYTELLQTEKRAYMSGVLCAVFCGPCDDAADLRFLTARCIIANLKCSAGGHAFFHSIISTGVCPAAACSTCRQCSTTGATAIEAAWLPEVAAPLCTLSIPLEEPPAQYSRAADAVLSWHDVRDVGCLFPTGWPECRCIYRPLLIVTRRDRNPKTLKLQMTFVAVCVVTQVSFGRHAWQLPRCQRPHPDATARAGAFAAALLLGRVLPAWEPLALLLVDKPSTAAAAHARHVPHVGELLAALTAKHVRV